jgi:hypothetical protein
MKRSIFAFRKRAFLQPISTGANSHIVAEVESSDYGENKCGHNMITLADCKRAVNFEFFLGTASARKLSLRKIDLLISVLTSFREALVKEITAIESPK